MKKNKVFANKIDKKIGNNQSYYDILNIDNNFDELIEDNNANKIENNNLSVREKLNKIFERNGYVFNVDVRIVTKSKEYITKIATKVNNQIITLDNDIIDINDIKDIIVLN